MSQFHGSIGVGSKGVNYNYMRNDCYNVWDRLNNFPIATPLGLLKIFP